MQSAGISPSGVTRSRWASRGTISDGSTMACVRSIQERAHKCVLATVPLSTAQAFPIRRIPTRPMRCSTARRPSWNSSASTTRIIRQSSTDPLRSQMTSIVRRRRQDRRRRRKTSISTNSSRMSRTAAQAQRKRRQRNSTSSNGCTASSRQPMEKIWSVRRSTSTRVGRAVPQHSMRCRIRRATRASSRWRTARCLTQATSATGILRRTKPISEMSTEPLHFPWRTALH